MPTSESLLIIVNGNIVTNLIQPENITIVNERGKRVSSATFTIDNGAGLSLSQWQTVIIYSADMTIVHFNGFLMELPATKRGISVDYACECSSVEVLLQRTFVNGSFSGTDGEILAAMLAAAYPDRSDMFDWSSGVTPLLTTDMNIDFQDLNLLDALDALSARLDNAPYSQDYAATVNRINMIYNPNINASLAFYGGTLPTGSDWQTTYPTWNSANVTWGAGFGEGSGGLRITSQLIGGDHIGLLRIGRSDQSATLPFRIEAPVQLWLSIQIRFKVTSASAVVFSLRLITYDEDGNLYHDGSNTQFSTAGSDSGSAGGWQTRKAAASFTWGNGGFDPYDQTEIPAKGWGEIELRAINGTPNSFTFDIDQVIIEMLPPAPAPPNFPPDAGQYGTYFDGATANSYWMGAANASASAQGANEMTWGTSPNAAFDVDIDSGTQIFDDLQIDFPGLDSINSVIVLGGYEYEAVDRIYHGNGIRTHWDLESSIFPADGATQPVIYRNIGSDAAINWSVQTVATRQQGFASGTVLYDLEEHWVEFASAAVDLNNSWRIVGRIKQRIRTIVTDDTSIDATGQEFTDTIYNENITSGSEAYDLGQAEIERRAATASVKFTTYEPGLKAGDEIDIDDTVQSFSETLIIERVTHSYLGGGKGKFAVEAGRMPVGIDDILVETHNLAEPKVPADQGTDTVTTNLVVDDDAVLVVDDDGIQVVDIG